MGTTVAADPTMRRIAVQRGKTRLRKVATAKTSQPAPMTRKERKNPANTEPVDWSAIPGAVVRQFGQHEDVGPVPAGSEHGPDHRGHETDDAENAGLSGLPNEQGYERKKQGDDRPECTGGR